MMALVRVEGLAARLPPRVAETLPGPLRGRIGPAGPCERLESITFSLERGEALALVGEDGAGKALLCATLLGLVPPTGGSVSVAEVDLATLRGGTRRRFRRRYQPVFSDAFGQLAPDVSVGRQMGEILDLWHRAEPPAARRDRLEAAMALCGVSELLRPLRPAELDAVERQQVALARAILSGPDWLILHDFAKGLDAVAAAELLGRLKQVVEQRACAVLFLTDDLAEAWQVGDTLGVLHQGRLVESGPADHLVSRPQHPCTRRLIGASL